MNQVVTDTIQSEIFIEASRERVFEAVTDPAELAQWWGTDEMYWTHDWKLDLRPGGAWSCQARGVDGSAMTVDGTILEVEPPSALAYTWNPSWDTIPATKVRYTLEAVEGGTRVRVVHSGFVPDAAIEGYVEGWKRILTWLQALATHSRQIAES